MLQKRQPSPAEGKKFQLQLRIEIFEAKTTDICFMPSTLCEQALGNSLYGKRKKVWL
jgi:hypothetical protein